MSELGRYSVIQPFQISKQYGHGEPQRHSRLNTTDCLFLLGSALCCGLALASVYTPIIAASLGQTNQLIVLGFLLGLMGYVFQGRAQKTLAAVEIIFGQSTIQNLEGIIQLDVLGGHKDLRTWTSVLFLLGLPLALSVSYKQFTGGVSITHAAQRRMEFGPTPPPGTENVGWGLSLFSSTMEPFWSNPQYPNTYGYSLATGSRDKAALLDSPLKSSIDELRNSMRADQTFLISAVVSAIQADMLTTWTASGLNGVDMSLLLPYMGGPNLCHSGPCTYENILSNYLNASNEVAQSSAMLYANSHYTAMAVGTVGNRSEYAGQNNSFMIISRAETSSSDVFEILKHSGQAFSLHVQGYRGTWNVTNDAASLANVEEVSVTELLNTTYSFAEVEEIGIENTYYAFQDVYQQMLPEFDWKYPERRTWNARDTYDYSTAPLHNISTDTVFAATMLWSRLATKVGPTNPEYGIGNADRGVMKYTIPVDVIIYTQTLTLHWGLAVVLGTFPLLTLLCVVLRATLLISAPVSNGFGLVSIMAAVEVASLTLLYGAGYSGVLKVPIRAKFSAHLGSDGEGWIDVGLAKASTDKASKSKTKMDRAIQYH